MSAGGDSTADHLDASPAGAYEATLGSDAVRGDSRTLNVGMTHIPRGGDES